MTMLVNKPQRVQVLLTYSEERKKEMKVSHEKSCQALADIVRSAIEKEADGKVSKVQALGKGFADLLIEGNVSNAEKLVLLQNALKKINKDIGAEKLYLLTKDQ